MRTGTFTIDGPLDLRRTLGPLGSGAGRIAARADSRDAVRAAATPLGPATLRLHVAGGEVQAEAWGPGASWMLEGVPGLIGAHDRPQDFRPQHRILSDLHRRLAGLRIGRTGLVVEALVRAVIGQKVTGVESKDGWRRLVRTHGEPAPGPFELTVPPRAERLAAMTYADFHPLGIERKRAAVVIDVAHRARRMEEAAAMEPAAAYARLTTVPGVGPWTAGLVLGEALGDPDAVPVGDHNLPNTVAWALAGEPRADDTRMLALLEAYRGHRRRALLLLKAGGVKAPRFGPRLPVRSIRSI